MPDAGFPLPSSSYKELIKIIQGYGRIGGEASLTDVAKMTAINETGVSGNNKFLVAIAVIKGDKKKAITPAGAELAIALQHELADEIATKWQAIVEANDFLQKVVAAVRIRKGMDESSLESHVAYSAGQPKTPTVATGAGAVVDILKAAALLKEDGGNLVALTPEPPSITDSVSSSLSLLKQRLPGRLFEESISDSRPIVASQLGGSVQLNIDVTIQCTPGDLEDLGLKLRKVIEDFNKSQDTSKATTPQDGLQS